MVLRISYLPLTICVPTYLPNMFTNRQLNFVSFDTWLPVRQPYRPLGSVFSLKASVTRFGEFSPLLQLNWKNLAHFCRLIDYLTQFWTHFGNFLLLGIFLLLWMAQYWTNNPAIWSHWLRSPMSFRFYIVLLDFFQRNVVLNLTVGLLSTIFLH